MFTKGGSGLSAAFRSNIWRWALWTCEVMLLSVVGRRWDYVRLPKSVKSCSINEIALLLGVKCQVERSSRCHDPSLAFISPSPESSPVTLFWLRTFSADTFPFILKYDAVSHLKDVTLALWHQYTRGRITSASSLRVSSVWAPLVWDRMQHVTD